MRLPNLLSLLLSFIFFTPLLQHTFASQQAYVVYLGSHSHSLEFSAIDIDKVTEGHHQFLQSFLGSYEEAKSSIFYSYTKHINGFAAILEDEIATVIAKDSRVVSVFLNSGRSLHTTHSWSFLGVENNGVVDPDSIWIKAKYGEDTIVGNLDTGVWPESKSFSDNGLGPIPSKWKGTCQNQNDPKFTCNRKLIGARYFNKGYLSAVGHSNSSSINSPRDREGHGTHTLSTAAGNFVANANVMGYGNGTAKGGSPKARVAAYKVCYPPIAGNECFDADILAAFDAAIDDGVDVLSVSLGGDAAAFFNDSVAIGSFHAVKHGIVVVCSAGNSGPALSTVSNVAVWQITVGASTMDRDFPSYVVLENDDKYKGESLSADFLPSGFFPLMSAADAKADNVSAKEALLCKNGTLDPIKARGKILVCLRGDNARVDKGEQVLSVGAAGMILANNEATGNETIADPHVLPVSHITYTNGVAVFNYINSTKSPKAYITRPETRLGTKPAPFMAAFSSNGPNTITPEILKPDITAPGVSIIAAYTHAESPTDQSFDKRRLPFNSISGTSMSCPHVSGIVGLLKTLHPDWSPAAIKSAIITTATTRDNNMESILNSSFTKATPFSYGGGHINPNRAMDPGLIYDLTFTDYLDFLCSLGYNETQIVLFSGSPYKCGVPISLVNFNYPSITVPGLNGSITLTRTVKNVGSPGTYYSRVKQPKGVSVSVTPKSLSFKKVGEEKKFKVTIKGKKGNEGRDYVFGKLIWSDFKHYVRTPIVVKVNNN